MGARNKFLKVALSQMFEEPFIRMIRNAINRTDIPSTVRFPLLSR